MAGNMNVEPYSIAGNMNVEPYSIDGNMDVELQQKQPKQPKQLMPTKRQTKTLRFRNKNNVKIIDRIGNKSTGPQSSTTRRNQYGRPIKANITRRTSNKNAQIGRLLGLATASKNTVSGIEWAIVNIGIRARLEPNIIKGAMKKFVSGQQF